VPLALLATLAGCGQSSAAHSPSLRQLPLVAGSIVTRVRECDPGANGFCALELVIVNRRYGSSDALLSSEHSRLRALGWLGVSGDTGDERAAESPGHKLRVTYATADGELRGVDLLIIKRPRIITLALSRVMFDRLPAISIVLEAGSS